MEIEMNTLNNQQFVNSCQAPSVQKDRAMNKGFSLVELIVVIAILAVMVAVLVPTFLSYVENSRAQKDTSATGELIQAVKIALADSDIYDEVCSFSTRGNVSCYIDKDKEAGYEDYKTISEPPKKSYDFNKDARVNDEIPYYGAGDMTGVTITFTPALNQSSSVMQYRLKNGRINKFKESTATMGSDLPKLTNKVKAALSENLDQTSNTYKNSDFTVFIKLNSVGGQKENSASVYGQYNGTNLVEPVKDVFLTADRTTESTPNPDGGANKPDGNNQGGTQKPDGDGSGSITKPDPDKPGEQTGKPHADIEAKMSNSKFRQQCVTLTGTITFSLEKAPASGGIDISEAGNGSVIAVIDGQNATIYGKNGGGVHCPDSDNPNDAESCIGVFERMQASAIDLKGLDTSKTTSMRQMFEVSRNLKTLDLSTFDTSNVTHMEGLVQLCSGLTDVNLRNLNTSKVTYMHRMFAECKNLTTIDVSSFDTSNVQTIFQMFYDCEKLTTLNLSNFDTSNVTDWSYVKI